MLLWEEREVCSWGIQSYRGAFAVGTGAGCTLGAVQGSSAAWWEGECKRGATVNFRIKFREQ